MATWKKVVVESAADTIAQGTTGNAATATALETARTIGGVSFDGTANINLPGVNTTGNQDTTGSAATLTTGRTIALSGDVSATGVSFDGSANITISGTSLGADVVGNAELDLVTGNSATDGYILSYDGTTGGGDLKWIANTASANDATITLSPGAGIGALGDFTTNQSSNETITIGVDGVLEDLDTLGAPASDGEFIVATGAGTFAYESGATVRTSLGLGTGDSPTFTDLTVSGDLTVNGTTTTINTTNLNVEDKLIKLADVTTPTTTTANGAGIQVEASATEAEWPELKWDNAGNLSGWTLSNYKSTSNTDYPVALMEFGTAAPSGAPDAGDGLFFSDTTNNNLYVYI